MENHKNNNEKLYIADSVYEESFDIKTINIDQIKKFKQHRLRKVHVAVPIILHYISFGIINFFYFGSLHSNLPQIKQDDFGAGKAIGFLFIPIFNVFYWYHNMYARLANRLNFQHKLRNSPYRVDVGFSLTTSILGVIPYLNLITVLILGPILVFRLQKSINLLVEMDNPPRMPQESYNHQNPMIEQESEMEETFSENTQVEVCPDCSNKNTGRSARCLYCNYPLKAIKIPQKYQEPERQERQVPVSYSTSSSSSIKLFESDEYSPSQYVLMIGGVVGVIAFFLPFFEFSLMAEVKLSGFDEFKGIFKFIWNAITTREESSSNNYNNNNDFFSSYTNSFSELKGKDILIIITGFFLIIGPLLYGFFAFRMLDHAFKNKYSYEPMSLFGRGLIYTAVGFLSVYLIAYNMGIKEDFNFFQVVGSGFWVANVSLILCSVSVFIHD